MKCSIPECEKSFPFIYESHHAIENVPVMICHEHFTNMGFTVETEANRIANRCVNEK